MALKYPHKTPTYQVSFLLHSEKLFSNSPQKNHLQNNV